MKDFTALVTQLDQTSSTRAKTNALAAFFAEATSQDRIWTIALLSGRRPKRIVTAGQLRDWAAEAAGLPLWLFEESYAVVGDLAETIALVLPPAQDQHDRSLSEWISFLRDLKDLDEEIKRQEMMTAWNGLGPADRFVLNKLCTGGFRLGVSQKLMTRALAQATGQDEAELAHRLMGAWHPDTHSWADLIEATDPGAERSRPYPFQLAYGLEWPPEDLGPATDWVAERKWDGIRGQLIVRAGQMYLWSRGEELITDRFPEFAPLVSALPDGTVIDGEVLAWDFEKNRPLPFAQLQRRIGRKSVPKSVLREAPCLILAYDLLEMDGDDIRSMLLHQRRTHLEALIPVEGALPLRLSNALPADWNIIARTRAQARADGAEGVMLKRAVAPYVGGRKKGDWWKWKLDPLTVDAVMIYAPSGHGRRATLFTDYTFAVWDGDDLVPFAKAYSGLTDAEFRQITTWVRQNTLERFGPVRRVPPEQVFEIAFEGIQASSRHKSGIALRFPRMLRWRQDKPPREAGQLSELQEMLRLYG